MRISDWSSDVCSSDLDGDGDTAAATLTITINGADDGVTIEGLDAQGAELSIDEDDLPARAGEAPGSDTTPDGVTDGDSFAVSTPDGMGSVILDSFNGVPLGAPLTLVTADRSEEHTSELQSLMRNSYAVFCLNKKNAQKFNHPYS